jgi:hypothetical protein
MNGGGPAMHQGFGIRQLRHPRPRSAMSAKRRLQTIAGRSSLIRFRSLALCGFSPHLMRRLVLAEAHENGVPQKAVGRPGQISDLGHKLRLDPVHTRENERRSEAGLAWRQDVQRRGLAGQRLQATPQIGVGALVRPRNRSTSVGPCEPARRTPTCVRPPM